MKYDVQKLKIFVSEIMQKCRMCEQDSRIFAESLINAEARGIKSHGLTRLNPYERRLRLGLVDPKARPLLLTDGKTLLHYDANNSMGAVAAHEIMGECIQRASEYGTCFATVRGGNHFGYGAFFTEQAAKKDMIGIAMANAPASVAPFGGKEAMFGTNPLSVSIPAGKYHSMVLDMATSVVARGKIKLAVKEGKPIPAGWAVDADGKATTDPTCAKTLLPFGGPKGYGIAMMIEILCSCLSGATPDKQLTSMFDFAEKQNSGFFIGAIDISKIVSPEIFKAAVDRLFDEVKTSPKAEGVDEIYIAGEIEATRQAQSERYGLELSPVILNEITEIAERYNTPFQCEK